MTVDIRVPELGESVTEATVGAWRKKEGDTVAADEVVAELETDKVTVEATAPRAGVLAKIHAAEGETVAVGALLAEIGDAGAEPKANPAPRREGSGRSGGATIAVTVPELGESVTEASVGAIHKKPGDKVAADEAVMELETDKVTVEATASQAGVIAEISVSEGDVVAVGAVVATIAAAGDGGSAAAPAASKPSSPSSSRPSAPAAQPGPGARRTAEILGIDAAKLKGAGKDGRATKGDVLAAAKAGSAATPTPPSSSAPSAPRDLGPREERVRMSRLRQTIARRLKEAQAAAAMLTTFNEVDMTAVIEARKKYKDLFEKKHGVKLGFMSFFVKACVQALKDIPDVNAEIDGQDVIYKNHYDVGVAVGTERGLVVPVVRDADHKTMGAIEREIGELAKKARDGKLSLEDMQGGTFTITNGGVYGSLMSTPILNQPQSGILGMHKIQERPMAVNGAVKILPMMYLALSYDHRIVDGQGAVTFLVRVKECIEDPERLMLDL